MGTPIRDWVVSLAIIVLLLLASEQSLAQEQKSSPSGQEQRDWVTCANPATKADTVLEACTRALERDVPRMKAFALINRAQAWKSKGDGDRALADLSEAISADSKFAYAYEKRGDFYRERDQCRKGIPDYDRAIELVPSRAELHFGRGMCRLGTDLESALKDLDEAVKLDPKNAHGVAALACSEKGRINFMKGDLDRALAEFSEAIRLNPRRASFHYDRGAVLIAKDEKDRAVADFDRAIELSRGNSPATAALAWSAKGRLHLATRDLDRAIGDLDQAIRLDPKIPSFYVDRAAAKLAKGEYERAIADADEAIKLDPKSFMAFINRGEAHRNKEDFDRAIQDHDEAIALAPNAAFAFHNRGDAYKEKGDYARAIQDYTQSLTLNPDDLAAYASRGLAHFYQGEFTSAAEDFNKIVQSPTASPYPLLMLYLSRARSGVHDAKKDFERAAERIKNKADWPFPIVELFLEERSLSSTASKARRPQEQCEFQFYVAEWQLLRNARELAAKGLQAAVEKCPKNTAEFRAAKEEQKRLKP